MCVEDGLKFGQVQVLQELIDRSGRGRLRLGLLRLGFQLLNEFLEELTGQLVVLFEGARPPLLVGLAAGQQQHVPRPHLEGLVFT